MSSTTGLKAGDTLHEISRLRALLRRHQGRAASAIRSRNFWRERAAALRTDRDYWRTRALQAERTKGATR